MGHGSHHREARHYPSFVAEGCARYFASPLKGVAALTPSSPPRWFVLALTALAAAVYLPGLTSPFIHYEDALYLSKNPVMQLAGLEGFARVWSSDRAWSGEFVEFFPLRDTVYWLLWRLWPELPTPFHVVSLLCHVAATLLVYRLVSKLDPSRWVAGCTALLFAVHPIHVGSVTWAASLKDPMYTALLLGGLLAYQSYREKHRVGHYALCLGLLSAALLVKSMALVAPLLLLGLELAFPSPGPRRAMFARLLGPALICGAFTLHFVGIGMARALVGRLHGGSVMSHWVLITWAQARYALQAFVPTSFELIECFSPVQRWTDPRFFAGLATLLLAVGLAVRWRKRPLLLFFLAWHFINLLPVSNLIPFPAVMGDRYLYASSVAACWCFATLLETFTAERKTLLAGVLVTAFALVTAWRTSLWHHEGELWAASEDDPACVSDPDFPAAQVHQMRAWTAPTPELQLAAFDRALASPVFSGATNAESCNLLLPAIMLALGERQTERAVAYSRRAIRACPKRPDLWNAAMLATLHVRPDLAYMAADQAWQLEPSDTHRLLRALTALEVKVEPAHVTEVQQSVAQNPQRACAVLEVWKAGASLAARESVAESAARCAK